MTAQAITQVKQPYTFSGNITFGEFYDGAITAGMLGPSQTSALSKGVLSTQVIGGTIISLNRNY